MFQEDAVIKIQSLMRSKWAKSDYKALSGFISSRIHLLTDDIRLGHYSHHQPCRVQEQGGYLDGVFFCDKFTYKNES